MQEGLESQVLELVQDTVGSLIPVGSEKAVAQDIVRLAASPTASMLQLETLLDVYKRQSLKMFDSDAKWSTLLQGLQNITMPPDLDSISQRDALHPQPPLSREALETHENFLRSPSIADGYAESFENIDRLSDRRVFASNADPSYSRQQMTVTLESLRKPYYHKMIPEEDILNCAPYTLLATTSNLFPINEGKISIPNNIPNAESGILHLIFEAALLYQTLDEQLRQYSTSAISPLKKALIIELSRRLRGYTGFINNIASSNTGLKSLKSLYFEIYDMIILLRLFTRLIDGFDHKSGDSLLSEIASLRNHGDIIVKSTCVELFQLLSSFYLEYISNWMTAGKLDSTYNEFFVKEIQEQAVSEQLLYYLDNNCIPQFISPKVADQVFMVGKTFLFIENYCKDLPWLSVFSKSSLKKFQVFGQKGFTKELFELIASQYDEIVAYSNKILFDKFYYKETIMTLKDILLMARGDLIDTLMITGREALDLPSSSIPNYILARHLQNSVQMSSLRNWMNKYDHNTIINRLDARVLDLGHGSTGWDVFTLDYLLEPPLSIVLNVNREGSRKEYLRIFNFLWRFKKNRFFNNKCSLDSNVVMRDFRKIHRFSPLVRDIMAKLSKMNILRYEVQQFSNKLEEYCFQSIIDKESKIYEASLFNSNDVKTKLVKLENGLKVYDGALKPKKEFVLTANQKANDTRSSLKNIDTLCRQHQEYLNNILAHNLLLTTSNNNGKVGRYSGQPYATTLIIVLNMVYEFLITFGELNDISNTVMIQLNLQSEQAQLNDNLVKFNSCLGTIVSQYKQFKEHSLLFIKDLRNDADEELEMLSRYLR